MSSFVTEQVATATRDLQRRRRELIGQLHQCTCFIHGSLVEGERRRSKNSERPPRPFRYLSRRYQGRTRNTYLRATELPAVRAALTEYEQVCELVQAIGELNVKLLKAAGELLPCPGTGEKQ